jgi:hypothetical protein
VVYFTNSPRAIIIAAFCSMAIIAFTYFVIVKPQTDNANKQVDKALNQFAPSSGSSSSGSNSGAPSTSQLEDKAKKIQDCVAKAGTDIQKAQACASQF